MAAVGGEDQGRGAAGSRVLRPAGGRRPELGEGSGESFGFWEGKHQLNNKSCFSLSCVYSFWFLGAFIGFFFATIWLFFLFLF
jgi:hypothetical protein